MQDGIHNYFDYISFDTGLRRFYVGCVMEWELNNLHILTCFFIRLRPCSNSYVARYVPVATRTKPNKKPSR